MSDYPQDCNGRMIEVLNGEKMLLDLPEDVTTPTARVDDKIYYVGELLQRETGKYFIPERFFTRPHQHCTPRKDDDELFSLGYETARSEVCIHYWSYFFLSLLLLKPGWICS
jgi:hypothetical protein